ncbi:MAG: hypothetical protein DA330_06090 [Nitrososphaera sp.]|nr:hypothetical protein [Nitrososphaera sp.]
MDDRVRAVVSEKIDETLSKSQEIRRIQKLVAGSNDLAVGIAIGRIYNSFHYQTRRILKRSATDEEFEDFLAMLDAQIGKIRAEFS